MRTEIHQPRLSHFPLLVEFFIEKLPVNNKDSRVLRLVNLTLADKTQLSFHFLNGKNVKCKNVTIYVNTVNVSSPN